MQTCERGALVSTVVVFWTVAERPSSRSATRSRYCPSGTVPPSSPLPSQTSRSGRLGCIGDVVGQPLDAVAVEVDDVDRGVVGDPQPDRDAVDVALAVAVGREVARDLADLDDRRRALEALRDEEGRERGAHQHQEGDPGDDGHRPQALIRLVGADDDDHVPLLRRVGDQRLRRVVELLDVGDAERLGRPGSRPPCCRGGTSRPTSGAAAPAARCRSPRLSFG